MAWGLRGTGQNRHVPVRLVFKWTFRSYRRAIRPWPDPGIKRGAATSQSSSLTKGLNQARGNGGVPNGALAFNNQLRLSAPGLTGVVVQTLLSVYRLYLGLTRARSGPGACLTLILTHPSEASSNRT